MELTKEEYTALYLIKLGMTDINWLSSSFDSKERTEKIVISLEKKEYIRIERREGNIYSFIETEKGINEINNKHYSKWLDEMEEKY